MKSSTLKSLFCALAMVGFASHANATIYQVNFTAASTLDTTNGGFNALNFSASPPSGAFATLTFNSNNGTFSLTAASNISAFFAANTIIDAISFETNQSRSDVNDANVSGGGITNFVESNGGPDFTSATSDDFDFTYTFDNDQVLSANETVNFTITGLNSNCLTANSGCAVNQNNLAAGVFAVRVRRSVNGTDPAAWAMGSQINANGGAFAATSIPVPEPESYMMMLAGLGLLGFSSRKRHHSKS